MATYILRCVKCGKAQQVTRSLRRFNVIPDECQSGCVNPIWKQLRSLTNFTPKGDDSEVKPPAEVTVTSQQLWSAYQSALMKVGESGAPATFYKHMARKLGLED